MGIALIVLGLIAAGAVVDFAIENDLGDVEQSYELFGGSLTLSQTEIVLGAAALGALAFLCLALGIRMSRAAMERRRIERNRLAGLERMNAALERENSQLRTTTTATTTGAWAAPRDEVPGGRPEEAHVVRVPDTEHESDGRPAHRHA